MASFKIVWIVFAVLFALNSFIFAERQQNLQVKEDLRILALANNDMALRLYERLSNATATNMFFSPLSLSISFGMLLQGTQGDTERELTSVLGYENVSLSKEQVSAAYDRLLSTMLSPQNVEHLGYNLNIINKILIQEDVGLLPSYKKLVSKLYRASVLEVNFGRNSQEIVRSVNDWVKTSTNGKINSIVTEFKPNTIMAFLNAVYFKSTWKLPFPKIKTNLQKFHNDGLKTNARNVPFMHKKSKFGYAAFPDVQVLELPYSGSCFSMVIILPNKQNGLKYIFNTFMKNNITSIRKHLQPTNVIVSLPKFKISYSKDLSPELHALGIQAIFNPKLADFSGMITGRNAFVSQIIHKAAIEVNEDGSEAAAVTGMFMIPVRMPIAEPPTPEFTADHPFLFFIIDRVNDMILFVGCVNKL